MAVILSPYQNRYQYNSYAVSKNINRPDSGGTVAGEDSGGGQTVAGDRRNVILFGTSISSFTKLPRNF